MGNSIFTSDLVLFNKKHTSKIRIQGLGIVINCAK